MTGWDLALVGARWGGLAECPVAMFSLVGLCSMSLTIWGVWVESVLLFKALEGWCLFKFDPV